MRRLHNLSIKFSSTGTFYVGYTQSSKKLFSYMQNILSSPIEINLFYGVLIYFQINVTP